jgi:NADH:ubiquinone oxidoreductase subunit E
VAFLEAVEDRINDSSRGNLLVHTLNVLKSACLLIELLELVKNQFSYMTRRVNEIRAKITQISVQFMNEV